MLLFISEIDYCLAAREATPLERLFLYLWAERLDRALAAGASAESSALLSLRAQWLVRPRLRRELGQTVRSIVEEAWEPLPPRPALASEAHKNGVRRCAEPLSELADCLLTPAPVSAVGMARALLLITDATGPLYYPPADDQLGVAVQRAVLALDR